MKKVAGFLLLMAVCMPLSGMKRLNHIVKKEQEQIEQEVKRLKALDLNREATDELQEIISLVVPEQGDIIEENMAEETVWFECTAENVDRIFPNRIVHEENRVTYPLSETTSITLHLPLKNQLWYLNTYVLPRISSKS